MDEVSLACAPIFGTHSDDRVKVHHGAAKPARMCGRHARYLDSSDFKTMRAAGTIE